jgi:hypothetical protein
VLHEVKPSEVAVRLFLELLHQLKVAREDAVSLQKRLLIVHDVFVGWLPTAKHLNSPEVIVFQHLHKLEFFE